MTRSTGASEKNWQHNVEYGGFYVRMAAMVIDSLVVMMPLSLLFAAFYTLMWGGENFGTREAELLQATQAQPEQMREVLLQFAAEGRYGRLLLENLLFTAASGGLFVAMWYYLSSSPGKLVMGLLMVDADSGLPPTTRQNIVRYLGYFVSALPFMLGFFFVGWDKRKQGWHDKMANTVVVYKRSLPRELLASVRYKDKTPENAA